jgi:hypothetical protein
MNLRKSLSIVAIMVSGCAAKPVLPEAAHIIVTSELPPSGVCVPRGDVAGSQGNWFTGDLTANKDLLLGARNEMKNQAAALGANVVVLQAAQDHQAWGSSGTTAYTMLGQAFRCNKVDWTFQRPAGSGQS